MLVCRRTRPDYLAGMWEFPGGKVEPGEDDRACLARELHEELGIEAEVGDHVETELHHYEAISVELVAYEARWIAGELRLQAEHDQFRWVAPEELLSLSLAPADIPIAAALVG